MTKNAKPQNPKTPKPLGCKLWFIKIKDELISNAACFCRAVLEEWLASRNHDLQTDVSANPTATRLQARKNPKWNAKLTRTSHSRGLKAPSFVDDRVPLPVSKQLSVHTPERHGRLTESVGNKRLFCYLYHWRQLVQGDMEHCCLAVLWSYKRIPEYLIIHCSFWDDQFGLRPGKSCHIERGKRNG